MKHWIEAARPRTLPLALASIIMGSFLAASHGIFNWGVFTLTIITTFLLQILSNFANDFGDTQNGADLAGRQGPQRAVQSGAISHAAMLKAIIITAIVSLVSGITLLSKAFPSWQSKEFIYFLGLGFLSIIAAITYTAGKKPYGYAGLGDISVIIFFGLVGVLGTYYLQTKSMNYSILLPALTSGCFATAVLNINNLRDIESDTKAGKKTIPVRFGIKTGVVYHQTLILMGLFCALMYLVKGDFSIYKLLPLLSLPFLFRIATGISPQDSPQKIDTFLKKMALSSLLFSMLFGIAVLFSN
jgi:1,4-dihydroxy-2-naphthoate polyprenyltransferase